MFRSAPTICLIIDHFLMQKPPTEISSPNQLPEGFQLFFMRHQLFLPSSKTSRRPFYDIPDCLSTDSEWSVGSTHVTSYLFHTLVIKRLGIWKPVYNYIFNVKMLFSDAAVGNFSVVTEKRLSDWLHVISFYHNFAFWNCRAIDGETTPGSCSEHWANVPPPPLNNRRWKRKDEKRYNVEEWKIKMKNDSNEELGLGIRLAAYNSMADLFQTLIHFNIHVYFR